MYKFNIKPKVGFWNFFIEFGIDLSFCHNILYIIKYPHTYLTNIWLKQFLSQFIKKTCWESQFEIFPRGRGMDFYTMAHLSKNDIMIYFFVFMLFMISNTECLLINIWNVRFCYNKILKFYIENSLINSYSSQKSI